MGKVARERVSIARATGRRCRFLQGDTRFSPPRSCLRTSYLPAHGTTRWSFVPRLLPHGRYKLWARGIDTAGNIERKLRKASLGRLTVR